MKFWGQKTETPKPEIKEVSIVVTCSDQYVFANVFWPLVADGNRDVSQKIVFDLYKTIVTAFDKSFFGPIKNSIAAYGSLNGQEKIATALNAALDSFAGTQQTITGPLIKPSQAFRHYAQGQNNL